MFKSITNNKLLTSISKFLRPITHRELSQKTRDKIHKKYANQIREVNFKPQKKYLYGVKIDPVIFVDNYQSTYHILD